jgi:hypothetical protein
MGFRARTWLVVFVVVIAACGKSAQEVEAERERAQKEWNAAADRAEQVRRAEVARMVDQQLAAHQEQTAAQDEKARVERERAQAEDMDARLDRVRSVLPNAESAVFEAVHWNSDQSVVCGTLALRKDNGVERRAFVVTDDRVMLDAPEGSAHEDFNAAAAAVGCTP